MAKYCKSIEVLLDDVRAVLNKERDNHAVYLERYGRKIDDLPKLNVDGQLLDFGAAVGSSLRYQGQAVRMNLIGAGTAKTQVSSGSGYYGNVGSFGNYYGVAYNRTGAGAALTTDAVGNLAVQDGAIDAKANQASQAVRFSERKQIEDGLNRVRRAMTEKYKIEF